MRKQLFNQIVLSEHEDDKIEDLAGYTGDIHKNKMERGFKRVPI